MKKIFTLALATLMAGNMMAQMHGVLNFAGASTANVLHLSQTMRKATR